MIVVPETRKILRNQSLEDFVAMSPDDWWACLCSEEDLASCRESLRKGLVLEGVRQQRRILSLLVLRRRVSWFKADVIGKQPLVPR